MFWRFGFHSVSAIDALLDKPDVTLEEILDEDDLLQECKAHNTKLIEYLRDPNVLGRLLDFIVEEGEGKMKYSYTACEVLCCEIWSICESVVQNRELLQHFWMFLDRQPPLNPLQASYFTKVNEQFLEKKTDEMVSFIQSLPDIVSKLLSHIDTSAVMDLLLKIISMEKFDAGRGVVDWLQDEGLIPALISQMDPQVDPEIQTTVADVLKAIIAISANANDQSGIGPNSLSRELVGEKSITTLVEYMLHSVAPYSTATLTNGVSIIIELIRKNNSDYDPEPVMSLLQTHKAPTLRDPIYLGTMLRIFSSRLLSFQKLLNNPKAAEVRISTTFGKIQPLGFERFRICELYAELLHCSNMLLLNDPRGEAVVLMRDRQRDLMKKGGDGDKTPTQEHHDSEGDNCKEEDFAISDPVVGDFLKMQFVKFGVVPKVLDLFFQFPWNNFLHNVVYDIVQQVFNGSMDRGYNQDLAIDVFVSGRITERIIQGSKNSDESSSQPGGVRLGYMGHLTLIAEEVVKLTERYAREPLSPLVIEKITAPEWIDYVEHTLVATRARDNAILGGFRPQPPPPPSQVNADYDLTGAMSKLGIEGPEGRVFEDGDQFARYFSQQITGDLPDKFGSSDEDDDEDWMAEGHEFAQNREFEASVQEEFYDDDFERHGGFSITSEEIEDAYTSNDGQYRS
ncbi:Extragenic suppressor of kinetochore protein 1 [Neolecta irregularis DAH-3]|uniref:Extragenic suppressor of kinetochore protein 1 n=1 Tax=Neolecta irregularis (strain DAH-3) TaxID=1198029 RepID=A0A1U7LLC3_NEOID|nr:Extragenic suppressor of kinetochore protein 1 [Neolecta irregularis DAH-3]|eukprot:OLL23393.1 Extragenic suppressor of kinetochore protein 1 [Neolecta irregularis DAH-3]